MRWFHFCKSAIFITWMKKAMSVMWGIVVVAMKFSFWSIVLFLLGYLISCEVQFWYGDKVVSQDRLVLCNNYSFLRYFLGIQCYFIDLGRCFLCCGRILFGLGLCGL